MRDLLFGCFLALKGPSRCKTPAFALGPGRPVRKAFSTKSCIGDSSVGRGLGLQARPPTPSIPCQDAKIWLESATRHASRLLETCFNCGPLSTDTVQNRTLLIYDLRCPLAQLLSSAYGSALVGQSLFLNFDHLDPPAVIEAIGQLSAGDMVILVQSDAFYLNEYRLRLELFKKGIKNLEHAHLNMIPIEQMQTYIDSLSFVPTPAVKRMALDIKSRIDSAKRIVVRSKNGVECVYQGPMEPSLLNIGDYHNMKNIGGTFPIGEVFSEPQNLENVNGELMVFAYPDTNYVVNHLQHPFKIRIENGRLVWTDPDAPASFLAILDAIKQDGGRNDKQSILAREFGVGLNRAIGRHSPLQNVTAFERQAGYHISLGDKHTVYKKPGVSTKKARYHIDVFIDLKEIDIDGFLIFKDGCLNYPAD